MGLLTYFTIEKGELIKDDFIDLNRPFEEQLDGLYEDMFQVSFNEGALTLDVGWYETVYDNGAFIIYIIKDFDWDSPLYKSIVSKYENFAVEFEKALNVFNENTL